MFIHRCPWCGRRFLWHRSDMSLLFGRSKGVSIRNFLHFCPKCKNNINMAPNHPAIWSVSFLFIILVPFFSIFFPGWMRATTLVPAFLAHLVIAPIPFLRGDKDGEIFAKKSKIVSAMITWQPTKNKGLMKPRYQVLNHEIFPAYFFQGDNLLNGDGICVSLQEICWSGSLECNCKIQLVLDKADDSLLTTSDYFYLYHGKRQIAKGQINLIEPPVPFETGQVVSYHCLPTFYVLQKQGLK